MRGRRSLYLSVGEGSAGLTNYMIKVYTVHRISTNKKICSFCEIQKGTYKNLKYYKY